MRRTACRRRGCGCAASRTRPGSAISGQRVATALLALTRRPLRQIAMVIVNGAPSLVLRDADGVLSVISFTVDRGRIAAIDVVRNPDKLTGVREPG
jgi:RNA polymerase sigma-70 factor (ECF subfamily)